MRKFVVNLIKKDVDPEKSSWRVLYGKKGKDLDGNQIWLPDDHEDTSLEDLRKQLDNLNENEKRIRDIIKEIEKQP